MKPACGAERSTFGGAEDRSLIAVPLRLQDQVAGVLCVQSVRPAAYDDGDRELLEHLTVAIVSGIERADVYTRSAGLSRRLVDLHAVGMELEESFVTTLELHQHREEKSEPPPPP